MAREEDQAHKRGNMKAKSGKWLDKYVAFHNEGIYVDPCEVAALEHVEDGWGHISTRIYLKGGTTCDINKPVDAVKKALACPLQRPRANRVQSTF